MNTYFLELGAKMPGLGSHTHLLRWASLCLLDQVP